MTGQEEDESEQVQDAEMNAFQWTMSKKKKSKEVVMQQEAPPKTWSERQRRLREEKQIQIDNERQFPTLGKSDKSPLMGGKPTSKPASISTSNVWARFRAESESDEDTPKTEDAAPTTVNEDADNTTPAVQTSTNIPATEVDTSRFAGLKKKKKKRPTGTE